MQEDTQMQDVAVSSNVTDEVLPVTEEAQEAVSTEVTAASTDGNVTQEAASATNATEQTWYVPGLVTKCKKLNVRRKPHKDSKVVAVIPVGTKVSIDNTWDDKGYPFYKVTVGDSIRGFCMKQFISVIQ